VEPWIRVMALSVGGILGVNARYWLGLWMNRWVSAQFPWATFTINVSGSFAIGFLTMALARWLPHPNMRLLVVVGFLGGYTTFSTFAFESLTLWERGEIGVSLTNMIGSVVVGMIAVGLGVGLARALTMPAAERATRSDREIRAPLGSRPRQVVGPAEPEIGLQVDDSAGSGNGQGEGTAEVEKFGSSS
jgi:fluoride exporter